MTKLSPEHLSDVLSLLAHDLRNPLSAVLTNLNFMSALIQGRVPDAEEALGDTLISCASLGQVIGNLDVLSREFSSSALAPRPTEVLRVADDAALRFRPEAALMGVRIEVPSGPIAPTLAVDPTFFGRAVDNLIANALQYSPTNGAVRIECAQDGDRGGLVIVDQGPIVPPELRELAVSPAWQGEAKLCYEARYGRGLGLYCAAAAARIAGAELKVGEREGRSRFELSAPLSVG